MLEALCKWRLVDIGVFLKPLFCSSRTVTLHYKKVVIFALLTIVQFVVIRASVGVRTCTAYLATKRGIYFRHSVGLEKRRVARVLIS